MKLQHWITILALVAMGGFAFGCEEEAEETTETPAVDTPPEEGAAEEAIEEAVEEPAEEMAEEGEAAGGSACERAQSCCEAYVNAVAGNTPGVTVESTCAGVQQAQGPGADASCEAMISGWRQGLEAMPNIETPGACQ